MTTSTNRHPGFTIVELLVVIVVIGILASITIVSYSGVSKKAIVATLRSDLVDASDQLKLFHLSGGLYPTLQICPVATSDQICLKPSGDNEITYTTSDRKSFVLTATNGLLRYRMTEGDIAPVAVSSTSAPATQGPLSPGTVADDASVGSMAWINPSNVVASDSVYATTAIGAAVGQESHYLKATNFGFSVPADSTIDGILVEVERSWVNGSMSYGNINDTVTSGMPDGTGGSRIIKGGLTSSTDVSLGSEWTNPKSRVLFGSAVSLWGETWTPADINSSNFGFAMSAVGYNGPSGTDPTAQVDHIRITVYYTTV